jgi:acyl-coenzyme A synthetase/AMP-(fatty) acid ligase
MIDHPLFKRFSENSSRVIFIENKKEVTFGEFIAMVEKSSAELEKKIKPQQVVAISAVKTVGQLSRFFALLNCKAIVFPYLDKNASHREIAAKWAWFTLDEKGKLLENSEPSEKHPLFARLVKIDRPGLMLASSGTGGAPKIILHNAGLLLEKYLKLRRTFTSILIFGYDHISGLETMLSIISPGGCLVLPSEISPGKIAQLAREHKVDLIACSPSFLRLLLLSGVLNENPLPDLRIVNYGAESMDEELLATLQQTLPGVAFKQAYGTSESTNMRTFTQRKTNWFKLGILNTDYKIVDGELLLKNPFSMLGYLSSGGVSPVDGWYRTGDKVEVNEQGFFRVTSRSSDIINVGGEKVSAKEVEQVIRQFDGVIDVKVYSEPNALLGEVVAADVAIALEKMTDDTGLKLRQHIRELLPDFMVPRRINFKQLSVNHRLKKNFL